MCNIALHWTAHITTVQCNNLFIHSDLVSLAVCTLTVATCMHPYTAKFPFLHIIFQYIFCMYFYSKMVKFCEQINFHDISVFFSILVMCFKLGPSAPFFFVFLFGFRQDRQCICSPYNTLHGRLQKTLSTVQLVWCILQRILEAQK